MSLAKIGEWVQMPFRPFFATAGCEGLKMNAFTLSSVMSAGVRTFARRA